MKVKGTSQIITAFAPPPPTAPPPRPERLWPPAEEPGSEGVRGSATPARKGRERPQGPCFPRRRPGSGIVLVAVDRVGFVAFIRHEAGSERVMGATARRGRLPGAGQPRRGQPSGDKRGSSVATRCQWTFTGGRGQPEAPPGCPQGRSVGGRGPPEPAQHRRHFPNTPRVSAAVTAQKAVPPSVSAQVPAGSLRAKISRPNMYHESKLVAREYQAAKACLFRAFVKAGLGAWVEKPAEQDQFSLTP